jgi:hypothetical protein
LYSRTIARENPPIPGLRCKLQLGSTAPNPSAFQDPSPSPSTSRGGAQNWLYPGRRRLACLDTTRVSRITGSRRVAEVAALQQVADIRSSATRCCLGRNNGLDGDPRHRAVRGPPTCHATSWLSRNVRRPAGFKRCRACKSFTQTLLASRHPNTQQRPQYLAPPTPPPGDKSCLGKLHSPLPFHPSPTHLCNTRPGRGRNGWSSCRPLLA